MHVLFGNHLDGCPTPSSRLGLDQIVVGPGGFLDLLEMRLGLPPLASAALDRILDYRSALEGTAAESERFFSASFAVDPLASARVLLQWRDELALAGWDGNTNHDAPARLQDLAAVESRFRESTLFPASMAGRLRSVISALGTGLDPQIEAVQLADPIEFLPTLWRELLESLPEPDLVWGLPQSPLAPPGTRLHSLQRRLLDEESSAATPISESDHSIRVIESTIVARNAAAAASLLAAGKTDTCLIGEKAALAPLNAAMRERDLPVLSASSRTQAGALVQLAPLVLRLHWAPFNPQSWLEFLLHPISPVARRLSRKLASALNQTPSRSNQRWTDAIEATLEQAEDDKERKRINDQLSSWLDPPTFASRAPGAALAETIQRLAEWMGKRGSVIESESEKAAWLATCDSLRHLAHALEASPELSRNQLARLIAEWLPTASQSESAAGELGEVHYLSSPAHLLEAVEHVIWWHPASQSSTRLPWSRREIDWLASQVVTLIDTETRQRMQQREAFRAILGASQTVTIFHNSDPSAADAAPSILMRILAECGHYVLHKPSELIDTDPVPSNPLPLPRHRWAISDPALLSPRESESYSSLHSFLYSPWEWVLNYKARLRPGPLVDFRIVDDSKRRGSLLHGFVESLLEPDLGEDSASVIGAPHPTRTAPAASLLETLVHRLFHDEAAIDWKSVSQESVHSWVESEWPHILEEQAAHYLVPGNEASRSELLFLAKTGLWELIRQFRQASIQSVHCEEKIDQCAFCGGLLNGFIDLQVTNETGQVGLIDLKLGGKSFRRDELANGRHLQLAVYGHLLRTARAKSAHCAYFIFAGRVLLARSNEFFPGATVIDSKRGVPSGDWDPCWQEFETLWRWRRDQIERGEVEVTLTSFRPQLEPGHWTIKEPDRFTPYANLAGWEATS